MRNAEPLEAAQTSTPPASTSRRADAPIIHPTEPGAPLAHRPAARRVRAWLKIPTGVPAATPHAAWGAPATQASAAATAPMPRSEVARSRPTRRNHPLPRPAGPVRPAAAGARTPVRPEAGFSFVTAAVFTNTPTRPGPCATRSQRPLRFASRRTISRNKLTKERVIPSTVPASVNHGVVPNRASRRRPPQIPKNKAAAAVIPHEVTAP